MDRGAPDAYLDSVLIGGRGQRLIEIAEYDPDWPRRFEAERGDRRAS